METRYFIYTHGRLIEEKPNRKQRRPVFLSLRLSVMLITMLIPILVFSFVGSMNNVQNPAMTAELVHYSSRNETGFVLIDPSPKEETAPILQTVSYEVPKADTGAKRYMDYRSITSKTSMQWELQQVAWTDTYGFRRYGNYYMVAMGTYYAQTCGKIFHITLNNGFAFDAIIGDIKDDKHTDPMHQHREGNVVEFIVDTDVVPETAKLMGDMSFAFESMAGKIKSIEEIIHR